MVNKALRIMIADSSHARVWQLEQYLNSLGYYRVVPVRTLEEVWLLSSQALLPIDVLFINGEMLMEGDRNPWREIGFAAHNVVRYSGGDNFLCSAEALWKFNCALKPMDKEAVRVMMMFADRPCARPSQRSYSLKS
jgi:hypothetical protein